jgi:hypothetical protein
MCDCDDVASSVDILLPRVTLSWIYSCTKKERLRKIKMKQKANASCGSHNELYDWVTPGSWTILSMLGTLHVLLYWQNQTCVFARFPIFLLSVQLQQ